MDIAGFLDNLDLTSVFFGATLIGALLCIWNMQAEGQAAMSRGCHSAIVWSYRALMAFAAVAMLWMLVYITDKQWMPWPPVVVLELILDAILTIRAFSIWRQQQIKDTVVN